MGTSTHNIGQKGSTPLVPSWLDQQDTTDDNVLETEIPPLGANDRFTVPRSEFTRYINSGGRDSSQGRKSISNYIKNSLGGSSNATKRLGAAQSSSARLLSIAAIYSSGGASAVEKFLSLSDLAHKKAADVFIAITDFVCPDGGTQDEGIARSAYISAIEESPEIAEVPFESLTQEQMMVIVERSMANVIFERLTNDIGNKIIMLPEDRVTSDCLVEQIKDFVRGSISDAITKLGVNVEGMSHTQSRKIVNDIYKTAYEIMISIGEEE